MQFWERPKIKEIRGSFFTPIKHIQEKKDGYYCEVYKTKELGVQILLKGRNINYSELFEVPDFPDESTIIGELFWDGPATSVITLLLEKDPRLQFAPFAVPMWDGKNTESEQLPKMMDLLRRFGFCPARTAMSFREPTVVDTDIWLSMAKKDKIEGWVLKEEHCSGWWKLKPKKTVDAFVVSHKISYSDTYFGCLKSFEVAVLDGDKYVTIASVGGFDKEFKLSCNPKDYYGKVMEVEFQSVAAKGRLQFPNFLRWREDKTIDECGKDQL